MAIRLSRRGMLRISAALAAQALITACGGRYTSAPSASPAATVTDRPAGDARTPGVGTSLATRIAAVACEDFWGSIVTQIGGERVTVTNIIASPDIDPHDYEPSANDARFFTGARYVVVNGAGYDSWAGKLLDANPVAGRQILTVAALLGKKAGDNPHFWYHPDYVLQVIHRVTADLKGLDIAGASYYDARNRQLTTVALKPYQDAIAAIRQRYTGTPVGASESIFVYLAQALGLNLITPPGYLNAISEGHDPSAQDKITADQQLTTRQIKVYVYNAQNTTPDVNAQKARAQSLGIPIVAITETPDPPTQSLQDWQTAQLRSLSDALAKATGM